MDKLKGQTKSQTKSLALIFNHLGYSSSLVNGIIDKCDYSSTLDAKTKSMWWNFKSQFSVQRSSLRELGQKANAWSQLKNRHWLYNQSTPARNLSSFNALLIIDILPLVAIWGMPMGQLIYSMRASLQCLKNVAWNGIVLFKKYCTQEQ